MSTIGSVQYLIINTGQYYFLKSLQNIHHFLLEPLSFHKNYKKKLVKTMQKKIRFVDYVDVIY